MDIIELLSQLFEDGLEIRITVQRKGKIVDSASLSIQNRAVQVDMVHIQCDKCGWSKTYATEKQAKRGLRTHKSRHCTAAHKDYEDIWEEVNG